MSHNEAEPPPGQAPESDITRSIVDSHAGRRTLRARLSTLKHGLRRDPEHIIVLTVAASVAILSATDTVNDIKSLLAATLACLAVLGFSSFKQSLRQERQTETFESLGESARATSDGVQAIQRTLLLNESVAGLLTTKSRKEAFEHAMSGANGWQFRGGTGSFTRAWTLPNLARHARERGGGTHWKVQLQILDPENDDCCRQYAGLRSKLARHRTPPSNTMWTTEDVKHMCLATSFAAHWYQQNEFLFVEVGLRHELSTLRYDISSTVVITTNEDSRFPATQIRRTDSSSGLYELYCADFEVSFNSIRKLPTTSEVALPPSVDLLDEEHVLRLLRDIGIKESTLESLSMRSILQLALHAKNQYF